MRSESDKLSSKISCTFFFLLIFIIIKISKTFSSAINTPSNNKKDNLIVGGDMSFLSFNIVVVVVDTIFFKYSITVTNVSSLY